MRLHRLVITGVGPFRDRQTIDFDELSASRLFLIHGPTGSGKTTIIDALVYALYGTLSGSADANAIGERMRSDFCAPHDPTGVTCEFSVGERRFRIHRVPSGARDPEQPHRAASATPKQILEEFDRSDDVISTLTRRTEVNATIAEVLGLDGAQFRQLVVLPQGKFQELLTKTPAERMSALSSLLEDERIEAIQQRLVTASQEAMQVRVQAREEVAQAITLVNGALHGHVAEGLPTFHPHSAEAIDVDYAQVVELARDLVAGIAAEAARWQLEVASLVTEVDRLRESTTELRVACEAIDAAAVAGRTVASARANLAELDLPEEGDAVDRRIAELHERMGTLAVLAEWEAREPERFEERERLQSLITQAREAAREAEGDLAALPQRRENLVRRRESALVSAGQHEEHLREYARLRELLDITQRQQALDLAVRHATEATTSAADHHRTTTANSATANRRWLDLLDAEREDMVASIARRLSPDEPCPVCGSVDHPRPALHDRAADEQFEGHAGHRPVVGASPGFSELIEQARAEATLALEVERAAADAHEAARAHLTEVREQAASARGAIQDRTPEDVERAIQSCQAALDTAARSATEAELLGEELERTADEQARIREILSTARERDAEYSAKISAGEDERRRVREDLARVAPGAETATAEVVAIRRRVDALTTLRDALATHELARAAIAADHRQRELVEVRRELETAEAALRSANERLSHASSSTSILTAVGKRTEPLIIDLDQAIHRRQEIEVSTAAAIRLGRLVNAENARRLQLRSFALLRRFSRVLAVATVHLQRMSSGKFAFEVTQELGKGQTGLGIAVLNTWTGMRQDPRSLSGGETFYASLALALGLADVIRSEVGGSRLETLFVDEGFGSLDQDTLAEVLDQLGDLRRGSRIVGVVSHVTEMREAIADRIEVRPGPDRTSRIVVD